MKNTVAEWHKSHKIFTTTAILLCMFLDSNPIEKMLNKKKIRWKANLEKIMSNETAKRVEHQSIWIKYEHIFRTLPAPCTLYPVSCNLYNVHSNKLKSDIFEQWYKNRIFWGY